MLPTEEQVRTAAHHRWQQRGGHGQDRADWLAAERDLLLLLNYEVCAYYDLHGGRKVYLGHPSPRRCRYCHAAEGQTTFNDTAHALPEFIRNTDLIARDECDRCNKFFSETVEDSLAKFLLPLRTVLAIPGKKGVPAYRSTDRRSRIDFDPQGGGWRVTGTAPEPLFRDDADGKRLTATLQTQRYVPVRVLKCLVKMALAIMPEEELPGFETALRWVRSPDDRGCLDYLRGAGCYKSLLTHGTQSPRACLLRRVTDDSPLPYMVFLVGAGGLLLRTFLPMATGDLHLACGTMVVPRLGGLCVPGAGDIPVETIRLDSADPVPAAGLEVVLTYESRAEAAGG